MPDTKENSNRNWI